MQPRHPSLTLRLTRSLGCRSGSPALPRQTTDHRGTARPACTASPRPAQTKQAADTTGMRSETWGTIANKQVRMGADNGNNWREVPPPMEHGLLWLARRIPLSSAPHISSTGAGRQRTAMYGISSSSVASAWVITSTRHTGACLGIPCTGPTAGGWGGEPPSGTGGSVWWSRACNADVRQLYVWPDLRGSDLLLRVGNNHMRACNNFDR